MSDGALPAEPYTNHTLRKAWSEFVEYLALFGVSIDKARPAWERALEGALACYRAEEPAKAVQEANARAESSSKRAQEAQDALATHTRELSKRISFLENEVRYREGEIEKLQRQIQADVRIPVADPQTPHGTIAEALKALGIPFGIPKSADSDFQAQVVRGVAQENQTLMRVIRTLLDLIDKPKEARRGDEETDD